jgi:hypothetical protein
MPSAAPQALVLAIEATGEQIPPQADAAFAATVQSRVPATRVFGCARETGHQALVS